MKIQFILQPSVFTTFVLSSFYYFFVASLHAYLKNPCHHKTFASPRQDDKFERLFKMYAEKSKLNMEGLVFSFDGEKISPQATPKNLGMEDGDMIEVNAKAH